MRGDAQHPYLLDPVPGDTEISGGNLTEREMRVTGLQPPQGPGCPPGYLWTVREADTSVCRDRACQCRAVGRRRFLVYLPAWPCGTTRLKTLANELGIEVANRSTAACSMCAQPGGRQALLVVHPVCWRGRSAPVQLSDLGVQVGLQAGAVPALERA
jgi:hypothetical protein